jgi:hypothetical protein
VKFFGTLCISTFLIQGKLTSLPDIIEQVEQTLKIVTYYDNLCHLSIS